MESTLQSDAGTRRTARPSAPLLDNSRDGHSLKRERQVQ